MKDSHKRVESIEVTPKLKLYKDSRELIRQVNMWACYSWEVVL